MSTRHDGFGEPTVTDLQFIARARRITVAAHTKREEFVDLLGDDDALRDSAAVTEHPAGSAPERKGWWASLSVRQLHDIVRQHGINVPAGTRRHEVVDLLIEHDIPRPAHPASRTTRRRSP